MCCAFKEVIQVKQGSEDILCTTVNFNLTAKKRKNYLSQKNLSITEKEIDKDILVSQIVYV